VDISKSRAFLVSQALKVKFVKFKRSDQKTMLGSSAAQRRNSVRYGDGAIAAAVQSKHVKMVHYHDGSGSWPSKYKDSKFPMSSPPRTKESVEALEVSCCFPPPPLSTTVIPLFVATHPKAMTLHTAYSLSGVASETTHTKCTKEATHACNALLKRVKLLLKEK